MSEGSGHPDARAFLEDLEVVEKQLTLHAAFLKKAKSHIQRTKRALSTKPAIGAQILSLLGDLRRMQPVEISFSADVIADALEHRLHEWRDRSGDSFALALRGECESNKLSFRPLQEGFGVGPFKVVLNPAKEIASLQYAKIELVKDVPLSPPTIVGRAVALNMALLGTSPDLSQFANQLEEAMRVALVRLRRPSNADLRVDLPAVFREMIFIRQEPARSGAQSNSYILPRFIVELKTLVQSNQNLGSDKQFRIEPAALENTRDSKKSVFIPNDLSCGYGEGTYCQAITLRTQKD